MGKIERYYTILDMKDDPSDCMEDYRLDRVISFAKEKGVNVFV
jgi:hypothetical protein